MAMQNIPCLVNFAKTCHTSASSFILNSYDGRTTGINNIEYFTHDKYKCVFNLYIYDFLV